MTACITTTVPGTRSVSQHNGQSPCGENDLNLPQGLCIISLNVLYCRSDGHRAARPWLALRRAAAAKIGHEMREAVYLLKGDTYGGMEGRMLTVPMYLVGRVAFEYRRD